DFLPGILTHVSHEQTLAHSAIEGKSPRVAEAVGPDFAFRAIDANEWVIGRNRIGRARVDIDAEHLAEQRAEFLAVPLRIAGRAPITGTDVKKAVRPECQLATVVVVKRLIEAQQHLTAIGIGQIAVRGRDMVFGNGGLQLSADATRVVDEESS